MIELFFQQNELYFGSDAAIHFIRIFFFYFSHFQSYTPTYDTSRTIFVSKLLNCLKQPDENLILESYRVLNAFFNSSLKFDFDLINTHLISTKFSAAILPILLKVDSIPASTELIEKLIARSVLPEWLFVLYKIGVSSFESSKLIFSNPNWISEEFMTYEGMFKLIVIFCRYPALLDSLKTNLKVHSIISTFILSASLETYPLVSKIISILTISQETFKIYSANGSIRKFLFESSLSNDEAIVISALIFLYNFAAVSYSPEYQLFLSKMYELYRNNNPLVSNAISVFALLSQYKEFQKSFIQIGLKKYFESLQNKPEHKTSVSMFLQNIK